jgi:hypothetical protein
VRKLIVGIVLLFAAGCAPITTGIYDTENKTKEPWKFMYSGSVQEANKLLKRCFVLQGYTIQNDDVESGFMVTSSKKLSEDECYNTSGMDIMMRGNTRQSGFIKVIYDTSDSKVICSIFAILQMQSSYQESAFVKRDLNIDDLLVPQGHPFAQKIRSGISEIRGFAQITGRRSAPAQVKPVVRKINRGI